MSFTDTLATQETTEGQAAQAPASTPIDTAVAESKAKLSRANQVPPRRKRGRPRKHPRPAAEPRHEQSNDFDAQPGVEPSQPAAQIADLTPLIAPVLEMPGALLAEQTGFEGFKLAEAEKNMLAPQFNTVANQYGGSVMQSPHAPAYVLAGSIIFLGVTKYLAYRAWLREKEKAELEKAKKAEAEAQPAMTSAFPVVSAV